jgi:hypothetical protein
MNKMNSSNIDILKKYLLSANNIDTVDYCGISSKNDFSNFENIINFKYKVISNKYQFSKICDFITKNKSELELNYDWFIKFRPDLRLLEPINFELLSDISINARARVYTGPKKIKFGMSVNGIGIWQNVGHCVFDKNESFIILDDQFFIFNKNIIKQGGFDKIYNPYERETEWIHTTTWQQRNIHLNIIGIHIENTKYNTFSGHLNM